MVLGLVVCFSRSIMIYIIAATSASAIPIAINVMKGGHHVLESERTRSVQKAEIFKGTRIPWKCAIFSEAMFSRDVVPKGSCDPPVFIDQLITVLVLLEGLEFPPALITSSNVNSQSVGPINSPTRGLAYLQTEVSARSRTQPD